MSHETAETKLSPVEQEFNDAIQHADDFYKIELLRPAKKWYQKALELNIENEKVKQKIVECDKLLAFERKVIVILTAVALVIICIIEMAS